MGKTQPLPILITGGGRRIGLALAWHFINQKQPVIVSYHVVERGSDKHIAYAASKAALDNMTRSFARKLAPEVKVNSIAPSLILFNEHDDAEYRQQALNKSLMKTAPGEKEVIDLVDYLLTSCFVTGRSFPLDGGRHLR